MDELQKALSENAKKIVSHGYGDGTGERGCFEYNPETRTLEKFDPASRRKHVDAPYVIGDTLPAPVMSMTGSDLVTDSRSRLLQDYAEHGYECTGGDHLGQKPPTIDREKRRQEIRDELLKNLNDLRWGNVPVSEREKEICLREERRLQGATRIK